MVRLIAGMSSDLRLAYRLSLRFVFDGVASEVVGRTAVGAFEPPRMTAPRMEASVERSGRGLMIRVLHRVSTVLVLATGVIHTAYAFFIYDSLNESAIWLTGAGLGEIFVALLNTVLWSPEVPGLSRRRGCRPRPAAERTRCAGRKSLRRMNVVCGLGDRFLQDVKLLR